jgi:hypothetical protein
MKEAKSIIKSPVTNEFKIIADENISKESVERIVVQVLESLGFSGVVDGIDEAMVLKKLGSNDRKVLSGCKVKICKEDLDKLNENRVLIIC